MRHYALVLAVFVFVTINCGDCWVFNKLNYEQLARAAEDPDADISDDELRDLRLSLIYPGTKWCGAGNIADDYDDLGPSEETDKCCRTHDNCPDLIEAGETKHNLTNTAFYTRLNCDCDEKFRDCLHNANSTTSKRIGTIYFNALGTQCYREDYPIKSCKKKGGWFNRKCVEYEYDTNGDKQYQWFDVPNY
ncbi:phospholipase A2-like [Galleria mellonella]|uniref:Phospholipase A2 n=1 Tax=Galleria mellonella TaxID=7137 RepID=A0A6J1WSM5_GALME|nr:phospholipase A2-like [Galleria mellonella]